MKARVATTESERRVEELISMEIAWLARSTKDSLWFTVMNLKCYQSSVIVAWYFPLALFQLQVQGRKRV